MSTPCFFVKVQGKYSKSPEQEVLGVCVCVCALLCFFLGKTNRLSDRINKLVQL